MRAPVTKDEVVAGRVVLGEPPVTSAHQRPDGQAEPGELNCRSS